jgi:conjugative relaxase-like TrwC/TraI family protein
MAGHDPATGRDLGRRYGDESVRGYDATFSAPKSVSVLFALGDEKLREQVVEAHDSAVEAVLGWVEDHAHTRMRQRGHVTC